jgi:rhamnosyltransferase
MIITKDIAGVVVLYNPDAEVLNCIASYRNQVAKLYAVDNSDTPPAFRDTLIQTPNIEYVSLKGNHGISKALNVAAEKALAEGYSFLLCMDQDSTASPDMVPTLLAEGPQDRADLGLLSPFHSIAVQVAPPPGEPVCQEVLTVWTSGSLLNLNAYKQVGPFKEDYFIDFVDHEYCMRLNLAGYRIYKINTAVLKHNIGTDIQKKKLLWLELIASNHSPLRRYYITRNRLRLASEMGKWFPAFFWDDKKKMVAEVLTILFFEKERLKKISLMLQGVWDYTRNVKGKYARQCRKQVS